VPSRGLRSSLQPAMYAGIAGLFHAMLFLIPVGGSSIRPDAESVRGVRVRAYVETPAGPTKVSAPPLKPAELPRPTVDAKTQYSSVGGNKTAPPADVSPPGGSGVPQGGPPNSATGISGAGGADKSNREGDNQKSDYGQYIARLRTEGVQGWAKDSARATRQGWKGSGTGTRGWGTGTGTGTGAGSGSGAGTGKEGGYLDPRVRMVVIRYPVDDNNNPSLDKGENIERRYRQITYPELKFKQKNFVAGWWNVYMNIRTDGEGKISRMDVLRPETDGPLEKQFVGQVKKEIAKWSFERKESEIIVDVRFYVE
jgi:hypothetical protein